jgi:glutaredoxin
MKKKILAFSLGFLSFFYAFGLSSPAFAQDQTDLYFFNANGCPHCKKEKIFLDSLKDIYPGLLIHEYEVTSSRESVELLQKIGNKLGADVSGVPFTVIGEHYFIGYLNDETTGKEIEEAVKCAVENGCSDIVKDLIKPATAEEKRAIPEKIKIPVLGEIETKNLSLPALTFVIALVDGFNPCAMWVLLFLISLLLGMQDRKKMWILGTAFIITSAFVYFLFLSAWLNLFLFLGFVVWVRILIGSVSLAVGGYQVRDFFVNKSGGCKVTGGEKRKRIFDWLKEITQKKEFLIALGGIVLLAFAANLVELVCSAGLPAIFTQVLALSNLPTWQYYMYLILYILVFMFDDLFVFFVAMTTLKAVGVESKYARYSHLIGGAIVFLIGIFMLFKPEILMFG